MRITAIDLKDASKPCGLEVLLRRLVADGTEPLEIARWTKLLELVEGLQAGGPEPELHGGVILDKIILSKLEKPTHEDERKFKALQERLKAAAGDQAKKREIIQDMARNRKPTLSVSVEVDWVDFAPLQNGLPEMHYRIKVTRPGEAISQEPRTRDIAEAEKIILRAFKN